MRSTPVQSAFYVSFNSLFLYFSDFLCYYTFCDCTCCCSRVIPSSFVVVFFYRIFVFIFFSFCRVFLFFVLCCFFISCFLLFIEPALQLTIIIVMFTMMKDNANKSRFGKPPITQNYFSQDCFSVSACSPRAPRISGNTSPVFEYRCVCLWGGLEVEISSKC